MKQTGTEYLIEKVKSKEWQDRYYIGHKEEVFEQAKAMQEKELFEFFQAGQNSMEEGGKGFEQYYTQTYGGNK